MPNIFEPRRNLKPNEYPDLLKSKDAIRHAYWLHDEFNFTGDVQDFKVNLKPHEVSAIERTMLAIAQIEVSVKTFWWDIYKHLPKPEIGAVGQTFAESEVRHMDAYSHLLEILGLNRKFDEINKIPAVIDRMDYLDKIMKLGSKSDNKAYTKAVLLFSVFVEHVSLFSQFLIIMSFNKHTNRLKGISNVVEATSKEEQIHGMFWLEIINIIKEENPDFFDETMLEEIHSLLKKAYAAEHKILEWIFEEWELDFLPIPMIDNFIKDRFNESMKAIDMEAGFEVDQELLEKTSWFDEELISTAHSDFFAKRPTNYNKKSKSITVDDLF